MHHQIQFPKHSLFGLACTLYLCLAIGCDDSNGTEDVTSTDTATETETCVEKEITYPSLILKTEHKDLILERITTEPFKSNYESLVERSQQEWETPRSTDEVPWDHGTFGHNANTALAAALMAWLHDDKTAADKAKEFLGKVEPNWMNQFDINIRMASYLMGASGALDLLRDTPFLTEEEDKNLSSILENINRLFYEFYLYDESARYVSIGVSQNNHSLRTAASMGYAAMAVMNHEAYREKSEEIINFAVSEVGYLYGPNGQYIAEEGGVSEGPFYYAFGYAPAVAFMIAIDNTYATCHKFTKDCVNRPNDTDPWQDHGCVDDELFVFDNPLRTDFFHRSIEWSMSLRMHTGERIPLGDGHFSTHNGAALLTGFGAGGHFIWDWKTNTSKPYEMNWGHNLQIQHLAYLDDSKEIKEPSWTNKFMPKSGNAVFRSGWGPQDRYFILTAENGSARKTLHDHADGTSFVMGAYNEIFLIDTGYYKPDPLSNAITSSPGSHNIIFINGDGGPNKGLLNYWGDTDAFLENYAEGKNGVWAEARKTYAGFTLTRGAAMLRNRYFVVSDWLDPDDPTDNDRDHTFKVRFHLWGGKDITDGIITPKEGTTNILHLDRPNGGIEIATSTSHGIPTFGEPNYTKKQNPHVHSMGGTKDHAVYDAIITSKPTQFLTILAPYAAGATSGDDAPLTVTSLSAPTHSVAWRVEGNGFEDIVWSREANAATKLKLSDNTTVETDARTIVVSKDKTLGLLVRGTYLKLNGEDVLTRGSDKVSITSPL